MELKFRIWDSSREQMIYLDEEDYVLCIKNNPGYGMSWCLTNSDMVIHPNIQWDDLMQYTGLVDRNNKPVYVGDIIKYKQYYFDEDIEDTIESYKYREISDVIVFVNGEFKASNSSFGYEGEDLIDIRDSEVIGNIKQS